MRNYSNYLFIIDGDFCYKNAIIPIPGNLNNTNQTLLIVDLSKAKYSYYFIKIMGLKLAKFIKTFHSIVTNAEELANCLDPSLTTP